MADSFHPHPPNSDLAEVFALAQGLAWQKRYQEAQSLYLEVLKRQPQNYEALVNLGILAYESGHTAAAKTAYAQAARVAPQRGLAHLHWGHLLLHAGDLTAAKFQYESALQVEPDLAAAHQGLSVVLLEQGEAPDSEAVQWHRLQGFGAQPWVTYPALAYDDPSPKRVLVLLAGRGGDVPWRPLLNPSRFEVTTLAVDFLDQALAAWGGTLPPHDLVFNAIGDADVSGASLVAAERVQALSSAPWVNSTAAVRATGRAHNAQRMAALPGVLAPRMQDCTRADLLAMAHRAALAFPVLLRRPGFQTGKYFAKLDSLPELVAYLAAEPGERWLVIEYLNARGADGAYRKYRVMMVDGALYPLHLAISNHWKVHYFSAAMQDRAEHRAEEQRFLSDMNSTLGPTAVQALKAIQAALQLDYAGIDFGLSAQGELVFFEANATMVMAPPPADPMWDYRRAATERAMAAATALFLSRAQNRLQLKHPGDKP